MNKNVSKIDITIKELPEDERPREKLLRFGSGFLSNGELLALLIGTGTKDRSALSLANSILSMDQDGISNLVDCTAEELCTIEGIGIAKSCKIMAAIELGKRIAGRQGEKKYAAGSPGEVAALYMEEMRHLKKEYFKVLLLNTKNEILSAEDTSIGNLNSSIVHPREVYRSAVKKGAAAVIVMHNHPSGNPMPSQNDLDITRRLKEAGDLMGIPLLDHLIIGDGVFISLKEKMLL
ncbi:DNA repair protein RadC [Bacillota bacterium]